MPDVLETTPIKSYAQQGPSRVSDGLLLLRSDLQRLRGRRRTGGSWSITDARSSGPESAPIRTPRADPGRTHRRQRVHVRVLIGNGARVPETHPMTPRTTSRATRLRELEALLAEGLRSAGGLARLLGATQRTIQRNLEALAVHAATRLLVHHTRVNERHYRSALTKLSRELPQPARRYLEASVADIETLSSEGSRTLEMVARAWFEGRLLAFDYTAPIGSGAPHRNVLEVYFFEISPMNLAPYVMGYERSYFRAQRTFRLDRMDHARLLDERYTVPDDFDPRVALASAWGIVAGAPLEVRVRVGARAVPHVLSRRHRNLRVEGTNEQGDATVTITCGQDKHGLPADVLPWLMQWGSSHRGAGPVGAYKARATPSDGYDLASKRSPPRP